MPTNAVWGTHGSFSFDENVLYANLDYFFPLALRIARPEAWVDDAADTGKFSIPLSQITNVQLKNVPFWGNLLEIGTPNRSLQLRFKSQFLSEFEVFVESLNAAINTNLNKASAGYVSNEDMKVCPDCAESVKAAARKCRFCSYEFVNLA